jgi:hypothetical protein
MTRPATDIGSQIRSRKSSLPLLGGLAALVLCATQGIGELLVAVALEVLNVVSRRVVQARATNRMMW